MKKHLILPTLILIMLLFAVPARADVPFQIAMEKTIDGMQDRSWAQGYEPTIAYNTLTIGLPLTSDTVKGNITAELIVDDMSISPLKQQKLKFTFQKVNGYYPVLLKLKLHGDRKNGDFPLTVRVTGKDANENEVYSDFPFVLRVRDGDPIDLPRPHLSNVAADLTLGEAGTVRLTLANPSPLAEMTDICLTLSDASGDILPGMSDKLHLPSLMPGERCEASYPVSVLATARVAPHPVKFSLTFEAAGQSGSWEETFTLNVTQEMRLENGGVQLAPSVPRGDTATLTLPLMNLGRGRLNNVTATLSLPGLIERQSVLVGTLEAGESKSAKLTFTPGKDTLGEYAGEVTVVAEDDWGTETSFSLPISIEVDEPLPVEADEPGLNAEEEEEKPWLAWGLMGGCGLLLFLLILQGALLRGKIHRLEEDKL